MSVGEVAALRDLALTSDLAVEMAGVTALAPVPEQSPVVLSIVMPAYNEGRTILTAVRQVLDTPFPCPMELLVVDDGSEDSTAEALSTILDPRLRLHRHRKNKGKGAAVLTGLAMANGTHVVPFDADLEYSPRDLLRLLEPVMEGRTDIVFGSRLFGANTVYQSYRYALGNKVTTLAANLLFDAYISDLHTCLKLVPRSLLTELQLREQGFGLDTEITAQILKRGHRPFEVPVSYHSRSHAEGKKLKAWDGVVCMAILVRIRWQRRQRPRPPLSNADLRDLDLLGAGRAR